jgi:hypothetical protein
MATRWPLLGHVNTWKAIYQVTQVRLFLEVQKKILDFIAAPSYCSSMKTKLLSFQNGLNLAPNFLALQKTYLARRFGQNVLALLYSLIILFSIYIPGALAAEGTTQYATTRLAPFYYPQLTLYYTNFPGVGRMTNSGGQSFDFPGTQNVLRNPRRSFGADLEVNYAPHINIGMGFSAISCEQTILGILLKGFSRFFIPFQSSDGFSWNVFAAPALSFGPSVGTISTGISMGLKASLQLGMEIYFNRWIALTGGPELYYWGNLNPNSRETRKKLDIKQKTSHTMGLDMVIGIKTTY